MATMERIAGATPARAKARVARRVSLMEASRRAKAKEAQQIQLKMDANRRSSLRRSRSCRIWTFQPLAMEKVSISRSTPRLVQMRSERRMRSLSDVGGATGDPTAPGSEAVEIEREDAEEETVEASSQRPRRRVFTGVPSIRASQPSAVGVDFSRTPDGHHRSRLD